MTERDEIKEISNFLKRPLYVYILAIFGPWIYLALSYHYPAQMFVLTLAGVLILYIYLKLKHRLELLLDYDDVHRLPDDESDKNAK